MCNYYPSTLSITHIDVILSDICFFFFFFFFFSSDSFHSSSLFLFSFPYLTTLGYSIQGQRTTFRWGNLKLFILLTYLRHYLNLSTVSGHNDKEILIKHRRCRRLRYDFLGGCMGPNSKRMLLLLLCKF